MAEKNCVKKQTTEEKWQPVSSVRDYEGGGGQNQ